MNHFRCSAMLMLTFGMALRPLAAAEQPTATVQVQPRQIDDLFANPGMGWQTFHRFADEDKNLQGLPSSSAYFRFYWRELEPQPGQINFARFDDLLAHAHRAGQKLAFRVMCTGSGQYMDVPAWLKERGCRGVEFTYGGVKHWVPDFADDRFQEAHFKLIRELGRRYDGHPDLDLVDIGSVGLWGEWHMSGTSRTDTGKPVDLPEPALRLAIIDEWCRAFPKTSKVMLIGSEEGMSQAVAKGYGWRADCLGDMGGFSKTWNHMDNFYLQQLKKTQAETAWISGPVAFESCWDMRKWKEAGWDIRYIFDYGLRCHASYMNNKSAPLPEGARTEVERFLLRLGYRLTIHSLKHQRIIQPGAESRISIDWENLGVAPPYRNYVVALRLATTSKGQEKPVVWESNESIRGWLPGVHETELSMLVPRNAPPGRHALAVAIVEPGSGVPAVRLAIAGRAEDGWYPLSEVEVQR